MRSIIVIGAGGHARVLIAALKGAGVMPRVCLDASEAKWSTDILGVPVIGNDDRLDELGGNDDIELVNAVGFTRDPAPRCAVWRRFYGRYRFSRVLDSSAVVAEDAVLGEGVQVLAGALIQTGATVGDNTIVNTGAQIDHDCNVGPHCHIAPGAVLCGGVSTGAASLIGAGAVIKQGVVIGADACIAMGAVVIRSVPDGAVVAGVPAVTLRGR